MEPAMTTIRVMFRLGRYYRVLTRVRAFLPGVDGRSEGESAVYRQVHPVRGVHESGAPPSGQQ